MVVLRSQSVRLDVLDIAQHSTSTTWRAIEGRERRASLERSRLLLDYGIDAVALALDASASVEGANSLEKMLAHQLAVAHKTPWNRLDEPMARVRQT